ncbi:DUF4344 domain-containing metallopeptidase [Devosia sp. MC521]|uniref:DUF4344 domain-containing metallopeptidase n=1 Tax=Devosia sp. MC521 TaxID=2759954 RepID=UPI0015FD4990|nr:DUF4344 domain-containing metallopeptidase [Devosia sp. MC521]MBJ6988849.1 hypothetical protein [Devosia sp. MC521]QMW63661.1 hypothetical protein H4N61_04860 [Devosia sp. MC521]
MRKIWLLLTVALMAIVPAAAAEFGDLPKHQRADALRYAANNSLFTLYHETAHLLIDKLNLPVLGREEDAADTIATYVMLEKKSPDMNRALQDAAEGWLTTARNYQAAFNIEDYTAGYSPDRHRAYQIMCLMVGADGAAFRKFANSHGLASGRQHECAFVYEQAYQSVSSLLSKQTGPSRVDVKYFPAGRSLRLAERALRRSGVIEKVADELRTNFKIPGRVLMTVRVCDEPNAFYDTTTSEIIFCYELMEEFLQSYSADLPTAVNQR